MKDIEGNLWGIIYVSAASQKFSFEEMADVKNEIKSDCLQKNISGLIVYAEGNVLCYIEGPKDAVTLQYNQVLRDVRHKNLVKLFDHSIPYRYFEEFGLAFKFKDKVFKELDDFKTEGHTAYIEECLNMNDIVMKCISQFVQNNNN